MMLILGLTLGRVFTDKPDSKIRISVVIEDEGLSGGKVDFPNKPWSEILLDDLADTANIRVEKIESREQAQRLVDRGDRSAVVILGKDFSRKAQRCSFVGGEFKQDPINPLFRDGVKTDELDVEFITNKTQPVGASVIQQVVQVSLLRVVIPWMIGQAFDLIGTERFMSKMEEKIPALSIAYRVPGFSKAKLGEGIRVGIGDFFSEYDFNAKTWAGLTESKRQFHIHGAVAGFGVVPLKTTIIKRPAQAAPTRSENRTIYVDPQEVQYQTLVPGATVTFAFFLLLTVGWLFVAERRHNTLVRLRLAPITTSHILLGKMLPCLGISLFQGFFLLVCGKLLFGMSWGSQPWLLVPVVVATSLAAVGLSMLVAGLARTETQVAIYGTLLVIVLAGISGSLLPRETLPESLRQLSWLTPHAWSLDAYAQLLNPDITSPDVSRILQDCGVLTLMGLGALVLTRFAARFD
jgi:ABC-2 type transport system permease protein